VWKLEVYRVITNIGGWIVASESEYVDDLLDDVCNMYALEYRIVSPKGEMYTVNFVEQDDADYVIPHLGEVCNNWPQIVGDIRR